MREMYEYNFDEFEVLSFTFDFSELRKLWNYNYIIIILKIFVIPSVLNLIALFISPSKLECIEIKIPETFHKKF